MKNIKQQDSDKSKPYYFDDDIISITGILLILARRIKIIILTPSVLCIIAIIQVLFFAKPIYTSTSKIMSSSGSGVMSQTAGLAAKFGINLPASQSETKWVYPEILKSRTLARSILNRNFDTERFGIQKSLLQILTYGNKEPHMGMDSLMILAVDNFLGMISISENIKTGILTLSINASEPVLATEINKALIEALDSHQREYNKAKTSDAKQFIEERIIDVEKELITSEEKLRVFMDRNRRIENSPALQLEQQRLGREVTVLTGVFTTLKQQLETTKIEEVKESDYVVILDHPEVPLYRSKPNKKLIVILSGFFGIAFGIIIGFLVEYFGNLNRKDKENLHKVKVVLINSLSGRHPLKNK